MTVELAKAFKEPVRQIIILSAFLATVRFLTESKWKVSKNIKCDGHIGEVTSGG